MFNYTISENILYGKDDSSNKEIRDAADTANALEFIEEDGFAEALAISDEPDSLKENLQRHR